MNFGMKLPTAMDNFYENSKWSELKEPSMNRMLIYGNTLAVLLPTSFLFIWWLAFGFDFEQAKLFGEDINIWLGLSIVPLLLLHELLHAAVFPDFGLSSRTTIVFMPFKLVAFAYYSGEMTKKRSLMSFLNPFAVMTILPLLFCIYDLSYYLLWIAIVNLSFSGIDLISALLVYKNMPNYSIVRNSGYRSYYRKK
jgi:hypothetical protein